MTRFPSPLKISLNFSLMFAGHRLSELRNYTEGMELMMRADAKRLKKRVEEEMKTMDPAAAEQYAEWVAEDWDNLSTRFPEILRASLFVLCTSNFEQILNDIASDYDHRKVEGNRLFGTNGRGIERVRKYLKKVVKVDFPDDTPTWGTICNLVKIRNVVVHCDGMVSRRDRNRKTIMSFVKAWDPDLALEAGGRLQLSSLFVGRVLDVYDSFVNELGNRLR